MGLKEIIEKLRGNSYKKQRMKELQTELQVRTSLENRQKSANERELEGYMKEDREARIKKQLDHVRKQRLNQYFIGRNILNEPTIVTKDDRPILKEPNVITPKVKSNSTNLKNKNLFFH